jgi:thioredoxin-like negative regulator of GroEL
VSTTEAEHIRWASNLDSAAKMAAHASKPIVVHFYADWCGPCEQLDRVVFKDKRLVRAMNEDVIAVKVDVDRQREIADRFGVQAVPTDVYLNSAGELIDSIKSPQSAAEYRLTIQQLKRLEPPPTVAHWVSSRGATALESGSPSIRQPSAGGW